MVFFRVRDERYTVRSFITAAHRQGVRVEELGMGRIRTVTHAGVGPAAIDRALQVFSDLLDSPAAPR